MRPLEVPRAARRVTLAAIAVTPRRTEDADRQSAETLSGRHERHVVIRHDHVAAGADTGLDANRGRTSLPRRRHPPRAVVIRHDQVAAGADTGLDANGYRTSASVTRMIDTYLHGPSKVQTNDLGIVRPTFSRREPFAEHAEQGGTGATYSLGQVKGASTVTAPPRPPRRSRSWDAVFVCDKARVAAPTSRSAESRHRSTRGPNHIITTTTRENNMIDITRPDKPNMHDIFDVDPSGIGWHTVIEVGLTVAGA